MPFKETQLSVLERICASVLKCGSIPRHLAIIMDGNRRYARLNNLESVDVGHRMGYDKLTQTMQWCIYIGINDLTVYALSIENFKRTKHEVEGLMNLIRQLYKDLYDERSKVIERGLRVNVFGELSLLPSDIQEMIGHIVIDTKNNDKFNLNLCVAYTSRQEIANAFNELNECVRNKLIEPEDISESLLTKFLYTSQLTEPDILIRTSGEHRLSDFLLWQTSFSVIGFFDVLWPEFTIWSLIRVIFYYQINYLAAKMAKEKYEEIRTQLEESALMNQFKMNYDENRTELEDSVLVDQFKMNFDANRIQLKESVHVDMFEMNEYEQSLETFKLKQSQRIDQCLTYLENKRIKRFENMCKINS